MRRRPATLRGLRCCPGRRTTLSTRSAHSCITPAGGRVIARFLGTQQIDFTVPSLTGLGDRHFATLRDLELEVSNARIWGGINYRTAVEDGMAIGKRVAGHVLAHHFRRSPD